MVSDIINGKRYIYDLVLCKTNKEPVCFIPHSNFSITRNFHPNYNSISFDIEKYIVDADGKRINPAWNKIGQALLIHLYARKYQPFGNFSDQIVYDEYFYANAPKYNADTMVRTINAESWHKVRFENIKIRGYDQSRKLYDYTTNSDGSHTPVQYNSNDILQGGILNYIQEYKLPNWSIVYDYDHFSVDYSDNDKASINNVKNIIEDYIESKRTKLYDEWSTQTLTLCQLFGYSFTSDEMILNEETAEIQNSGFGGYISSIAALYLFLNGDAYLTEDEVGSALADNTLINKEFGRDWLPSVVMSVGSKDEYNINIIKIIYSAMFQKICNEMKNVLACFSDAGFNLAQSEVDGYNFSLRDYYDKTLECYDDVCKVYKAIQGLTVDIKETVRALSFSNDDLTSVFTQLEDSYICLFRFDNVNNIIYVYSRDNEDLSIKSNLIISPHNYMEGYTYSPTMDKIVTRLYFTGKDDLNFAGVNPTGQRFIDDFSPFLDNKEYMSDDLRSFLKAYNERLQSYSLTKYTTTVGYMTESKNIVSILNDYINTLSGLLNTAISYFITFYKFISSNDDSFGQDDDYGYKTTAYRDRTYVTLQAAYDYLKKCVNEFNNYELGYKLMDLDSVEQSNFSSSFTAYIENTSGDNVFQIIRIFNFFGIDITQNNRSLTNLIENGKYYYYDNSSNTVIPIIKSRRISIANLLTYEQAAHDLMGDKLTNSEIAAVVSELNDFIFEDDINVDYITDADVGLYYTTQYFKYLNTIPYEIKLELTDILSNSNYQRDWDNVCGLGTYIVIHSPETEDYQWVRLLSYTHSPSDNQLSLVFGNQEERTDAMNSLTKGVWQYSMRVAEKSYDYINKYDRVIKEAADQLGISLPDSNYDYGTALSNSVDDNNIYVNSNAASTSTLPPNANNTTGVKTSTVNNNYSVKISSAANNALKKLQTDYM